MESNSLETLILNKINEGIKILLNKNNVVDFKNSDKTKLISLDEMLLTIPELKLKNKKKKATLMIFSNSKYKVKESYFDEVKLIFLLNFRSLFSGNTLQELIVEYYDNNGERIKQFINNQLKKNSKVLDEPDVSKNYQDLLMDVQNLARYTKNKSKKFYALQIQNFEKRFDSLQAFEKEKINRYFVNNTIQESRNFVNSISKKIQKVYRASSKRLLQKLSGVSIKALHQKINKQDKVILVQNSFGFRNSVITIYFCISKTFDGQAECYPLVNNIGNIYLYFNEILEYDPNLTLETTQLLVEELKIKLRTKEFEDEIESLIVHELQHVFNPRSQYPSNSKAKANIKRLNKDITGKERDIEQKMSPTEIQARIPEIVYFILKTFLRLDEEKKRTVNIHDLLLYAREKRIAYRVDILDEKIRNKILREVYKELKELGYK